jgi:protein disulfide-isomerase
MLSAEKGGVMKRTGIVITLVLSALVLCGETATAGNTSKIWMSDYDAALKQAASENKYVVVSISGLEWCGWCMKLDEVG